MLWVKHCGLRRILRDFLRTRAKNVGNSRNYPHLMCFDVGNLFCDVVFGVGKRTNHTLNYFRLFWEIIGKYLPRPM